MTHVVMTADGNYLPYVPCMIGRLAQYGRAAAAVVVVVPPGLPPSAADPVRRAADRVDLDVQVRASALPQTPSGFADIGSVAYRSAFATARLHLGETLPEADRVLYLDVDLLVRASLDDLIGRPLDAPMAAARDGDGPALRLFGSPDVPYFNSGVMLLSLDLWRAEDVGRVGTELLLAHPEWHFQDQDVLNVMFRDRIETLPPRFNIFNGRQVARTDVDAAIVHFVGPVKPWHAAATTRFAREWAAAQQQADPSWPSPARAGRRASWERHLADGVYAARHSRAGRAVRRLLPHSVKDGVNRALLAASRGRSRIQRSLSSGLSSR